jgi:hypothetical protein
MLKYNVGDVVKIKKRPKRWSYKIGWTKEMDDALPKSRNVRISIRSYAYLPHFYTSIDWSRGIWCFDDSFIARCVKRAKGKK